MIVSITGVPLLYLLHEIDFVCFPGERINASWFTLVQ